MIQNNNNIQNTDTNNIKSSSYMFPSQWGGNVIPYEIEKRERWNEGDILPDNEVLCGIFGASGSGKTLSLLQVLPCIAPKFLKYVIICSRIEGNPVYDAISKWCEKTNKKYYFSSNIDESMDIIEEVINEKEDNEHFVIVLDDFNEGAITSRTNPYAKMTNEIFTKLRNYNGNMIFIVQSYTGLSTIARTNLNICIVFRITDQYALRNIKKDFVTLTGYSETIFDNLHKNISKVKHSYFIYTSNKIFIYINGKTPKIQEVSVDDKYKNVNNIKI